MNIDERYEKLRQEIHEGGLLDHEIRAIETIFRRDKKDIYGKRFIIEKKANKRYAEDLAARSVKIKNEPTSLKGLGCIMLGEKAAAILYPAFNYVENTEFLLQGMCIVAHELGHLYLGHLSVSDSTMDTRIISDPDLETEANEFAEKIVGARVAQWRSEDYWKDRQFPDRQIQEVLNMLR
ncbi:MAG: hypothetical protein LBE35_00695 [Clostridiales bacterium]|jgi:hypothetical protein|nr:hypothetical protein [Clostridiales bacterium]